jgi:perosamine synthetase
MVNKIKIPAILGGDPVRKTWIPYGRQYIDEADIQAVSEVLRSEFLTTGPMVEKFENKLCEITNTKYSVVVSSGTAGLHAACHAAGISKGDEVIISAVTFASTANAVLFCGGTPVFADIDEFNWNIDPLEIEKKITKRTKAIIAVDLTGQSVKIDEIRAICSRHNLTFIQDSSHALGTKYKGQQIGSLADMTVFSFHPVKTITTGEGGAIMTNSVDLYQKLKLFRTHGITRDPHLLSRKRYDGYNEQIDLGYNYRLTDFQAALGLSQLDKLDLFVDRRKEIVEMYNKAFANVPGIILQQEISESDTSKHIYPIRIDLKILGISRDDFYQAINKENIGLQVHYMPVYKHPYYQNNGYKSVSCPKAEALYESMLSIPIFYSMTNEDVYDVVKTIIKITDYYKSM